jgi:hypothetical protein
MIVACAEFLFLLRSRCYFQRAVFVDKATFVMWNDKSLVHVYHMADNGSLDLESVPPRPYQCTMKVNLDYMDNAAPLSSSLMSSISCIRKVTAQDYYIVGRSTGHIECHKLTPSCTGMIWRFEADSCAITDMTLCPWLCHRSAQYDLVTLSSALRLNYIRFSFPHDEAALQVPQLVSMSVSLVRHIHR